MNNRKYGFYVYTSLVEGVEATEDVDLRLRETIESGDNLDNILYPSSSENNVDIASLFEN